MFQNLLFVTKKLDFSKKRINYFGRLQLPEMGKKRIIKKK
jgi:hypothetical protein